MGKGRMVLGRVEAKLQIRGNGGRAEEQMWATSKPQLGAQTLEDVKICGSGGLGSVVACNEGKSQMSAPQHSRSRNCDEQ